MMEAVRTSETSEEIYFTRQCIPEDSSENHTGRRENLKSPVFLGTFGGICSKIANVSQRRKLSFKLYITLQ
jgi:hypothetical protein